MSKKIALNSLWKNIKTGGIYRALLITRNSEQASEYRVVYEVLNAGQDSVPWDCPYDLFLKKFDLYVPA